ncbi:serine/threonine protein kinase [bacterium]|nr:serine/threonine protein kinase [bacterium]
MEHERIAHFELLELIGRGSMGKVYRARDVRNEEIVALKAFYPDTSLSDQQRDELLARFQKEANILTTIEDTNVVGIREVGTHEGQEYIAMEFLDGPNLKELLAMGVSFTIEDIVDVGVQVLAGLEACHRAGIVHRDIKPANIVKLPSGTVKLADFGIARILTDATISRTGTVVGTPNYMSPEQVSGGEVTPRSDLFSLGVVLYELTTKHKPFDGESITAIMYNVVNLTPPAASHYTEEVPEAMDQVLARAMHKRPEQRYQDAHSFQKDLLAVEAKVPVAESTMASAARQDRDAAAPVQGMGDTCYCVDCGTPNNPKNLICVKCHRPLLKREMAMRFADRVFRVSPELRLDRTLTAVLNFILALLVVLLIYFFFRSG